MDWFIFTITLLWFVAGVSSICSFFALGQLVEDEWGAWPLFLSLVVASLAFSAIAGLVSA